MNSPVQDDQRIVTPDGTGTVFCSIRQGPEAETVVVHLDDGDQRSYDPEEVEPLDE